MPFVTKVVRNITFEEFKKSLVEKVGERGVFFREVGKYGWSSVEDILDKNFNGKSGPHWCDASPIPSNQHLLGSYDFNTQTAKYFSWESSSEKNS